MAKKLNFCTLFNSAYLSRGLALYDSLIDHCENFHLFVYAFDQITSDHLRSLSLPNITIVSLSDFEDKELLLVKPYRTTTEYCWTCTPSVLKYSIDHFKLDHCTYLDADIYFFSSPMKHLESFLSSENSVLITPHNYTPLYDQSNSSGIYCVQFMSFKNDKNGLDTLNWWRMECLKWCYARLEDGKFGDQKYLDNWTVNFQGIYEEKDRGIGAAPWNVQLLELHSQNHIPCFKYKDVAGKVVFYHFHGLSLLFGGGETYGNYHISKNILFLIYKPYTEKLKDVEMKYYLNKLEVDVHARRPPQNAIVTFKKKIKLSLDLLVLSCNKESKSLKKT